AVRAAGRAVRASLPRARPVTHIGVGAATVERVASNRRYLGRDGRPRFDRTSATRDPYARQQPEGTIDPILRTLSFWDGDRPVAIPSFGWGSARSRCDWIRAMARASPGTT